MTQINNSPNCLPEARDDLLELLSGQIDALATRTENQEPQTPAERDEQRRDLHVLCALVREYRLLARDTDVDEMQDDLDLLHQALETKEAYQ